MTPLNLFRAINGTAPMGAHLVYALDDDTRRVLAYREGQTLYVCFYCTKGALTGDDWRKNFDFIPRKGKSGLTSHEGFLAEYETMSENIKSMIDLHSPDYIVVTGYSQGKAHAEDLAYDLAEKWGPRLTLTTFDGPRNFTWGSAIKASARFARRNVKVVRFVMAGDPVPSLPPWLFGFAHVGKATVIGAWIGGPSIDQHRPENIEAELERIERR